MAFISVFVECSQEAKKSLITYLSYVQSPWHTLHTLVLCWGEEILRSGRLAAVASNDLLNKKGKGLFLLGLKSMEKESGETFQEIL
uniref:Uncharacterized protein n=1 Tax=Tanacetum cinerariifolium TaxID=118510 RepID=A0A699HBI0_TANCI|nr:hypothetical protein [Tanacetum cinerariifolium]